MDNTLTTKEKWEAEWDDVKLPVITKPLPDIDRRIRSYLPETAEYSLIEIGCAPGGWMAYFNKSFGYRVSGVEYAEVAAATTMKNMKILEIDADLQVGDFFTCDFSRKRYDVVFSGGFIEHFRDMSPAVEKLCGLSRRFVVTIVPNLYGVNGAILKLIVPRVYAEHNPIDAPLLEELHKNCGLKTLFCSYVGGVHFITPLRRHDFFKKHKYCRRVLTAPVQQGFNRISMETTRILHYTPRLRLFAPSLLYIGEKTAG